MLSIFRLVVSVVVLGSLCLSIESNSRSVLFPFSFSFDCSASFFASLCLRRKTSIIKHPNMSHQPPDGNNTTTALFSRSDGTSLTQTNANAMSMMEKHVQETKNKKEIQCLTALASWFLNRRRKRVLTMKKKMKKSRTKKTSSKIVTTLRRETMAIALEKTQWDVEKSKAILERFLLSEEEGEKGAEGEDDGDASSGSSSESESSSSESSSTCEFCLLPRLDCLICFSS